MTKEDILNKESDEYCYTKIRILYGINEFLSAIIIHNTDQLVLEKIILYLDIDKFLDTLILIYTTICPNKSAE